MNLSGSLLRIQEPEDLLQSKTQVLDSKDRQQLAHKVPLLHLWCPWYCLDHGTFAFFEICFCRQLTIFFVFFETGSLSKQLWMSWNLLCRLVSNSQSSACLYLPKCWIKGMHHSAWLRLKQLLKHVNQLKIARFCACKVQVPFLGVGFLDQVPFLPLSLTVVCSVCNDRASIKVQDLGSLPSVPANVHKNLLWPPYVKVMCKITSLYLILALFDVWHTPLTCLSLPAIGSISPAASATIKHAQHIHFGVSSVQQSKVLDRKMKDFLFLGQNLVHHQLPLGSISNYLIISYCNTIFIFVLFQTCLQIYWQSLIL